MSKKNPTTHSDGRKIALFNIICQSQETSLAETRKLLHLGKKNQLIRSLGRFINQHDIIRYRGRLGNYNHLSEKKEPILLTQDHLTKLIVENCYKRTLHSGTRATLIQLRTQFWIPRGKFSSRRFSENATPAVA